MEKKKAWKMFVLLSGALLGVLALTYLISFLIRGYRPTISRKQFGFLPTGLLVANSDPKGASVYVNERLATATDDTISLPPDEYQVVIGKDGFLPWSKKLMIKKEIVTQTNTILFKNAPDLKPLTTTGAINPTLSLDGTKIAYAVSEANATERNGLWVLDLAYNLPISRSNNRQITGNIPDIDWQTAQLIWSPDNRNVMAVNQKAKGLYNAYLIAADRYTAPDKVIDATIRLSLILEEWQKEQQDDLKAKMVNLPKEIVKIATASAKLASFSPEGDRLFYLAKEAVTIPQNLVPHPPARSTQPEERNLKPGNVYVYDLEQDINFYLGTAEEIGIGEKKGDQEDTLGLNNYQPITFYWLTNSHLIYVDQDKKEVRVVEFDNTNRQTIYSGPFNNGFVFPSPSTDSLIVLTSLHPDSAGNLYQVKVR